jgi:hypothetical protein
MSKKHSKCREKPIQEAYFSPIRPLQCIPQLLVREGPLQTLNLQMYVSGNNKLLLLLQKLKIRASRQ